MSQSRMAEWSVHSIALIGKNDTEPGGVDLKTMSCRKYGLVSLQGSIHCRQNPNR